MKKIDIFDLIEKFSLDINHICELAPNEKRFGYRVVFERCEVSKENADNIEKFFAALEKAKARFERSTAQYKYCPAWVYHTIIF